MSPLRPGISPGASDVFPTSVSPSVRMTEDGLVLGSGSVLVRMSKNGKAAAGLDLAVDRDRFTALMVIVGGKTIGNDKFRHIEAADTFWRRGDKALASLRLVFADLPRLTTLADAYRLTLAEHLLDEGMAPNALMKELGFKLATDALKYAPGQARIPAGHGDESGQFTFGRESEAASDARIILASEDDSPSEDKDAIEHQGEPIPTPDKNPTRHHHPPVLTPGPSPPPIVPPSVGLGPFAGRSIPAGPTPRPSPAQQNQINEIGRETGCHTCGTKDPGTMDGDFVGDHQPPKKLNSSGAPQRYFPHCKRCSDVQGGRLRHLEAR